MKYYTHN